MGIKALHRFCLAYDAVSPCVLGDLSGKAVAIDASDKIYVLKHSIIRHRLYCRDPYTFSPDPEDVLDELRLRLLSTVEQYVLANIVPVFVFDGSTPPHKASTVARRTAHIQRSIGTLGALLLEPRTKVNEERIRRLHERSIRVLSSEFLALSGYLESWGIPIAWVTGEADGGLAAMVLEQTMVCGRPVQFVESNDSDLLVCGVGHVLRCMHGSTYSMVSLGQLLKNTGMTFEQFVIMCVITGCDYNNKRRPINKAYDIVRSPTFVSSDTHLKVGELFYPPVFASVRAHVKLAPNLESLRSLLQHTHTESVHRKLSHIYDFLSYVLHAIP